MTMTVLASVHGLAMMQGADAVDAGHTKLLEVFVGLTAFALLVQAAAVVGIALGALKAKNALMAEIAEIKGKVMPLVDKSHGLVTDLTPQVKEITGKVQTLVTEMSPKITEITDKVNGLVGEMSPHIVGITERVHQIADHAEEIAGVAKDKVHEIAPTVSAANQTALMANQKTQEQINRVNGMVSGALDATAQMGTSLKNGITRPVHEAAEMVNGAKETVQSILKSAKESVDSMMSGTKGTVEAVMTGTKGTVETLLHGLRGFSGSLFAGKRKEVHYPPAAYRYNPAEAAAPVRSVVEEKPIGEL